MLFGKILVVLKFKVKIITEYIQIALCDRPRIELPYQSLSDLAIDACATCDDAFRIFFEYLKIDARLIIKTFEMRKSHKLHQVFIPYIIFGQKNEMKTFIIFLTLFFESSSRCKVRFNADNWLHMRFARSLVKFNRQIGR